MVLLATVAAYFLNAVLFEVAAGLRYSCPLLIFVFPASILVLAGELTRARREIPSLNGGMRAALVAVGLAALAVVLWFLPISLVRAKEISGQHTVISYIVDQDVMDYTHSVVVWQDAPTIEKIQSTFAPGATALVWTSAPFQFDFLKNRLYTVNVQSLPTPWLNFPLGASAEDLEKFLRSWGVRYVVYERKGFGINHEDELKVALASTEEVVWRAAQYGVYAIETVRQMAERNHVLYQDDRFIAFELQPGP